MIRSDAQREIRFNPVWQLTVVPDETVRAAHFAPQTLAQVQAGGYLTVPATVPGNFELDLVNAGVLEEPFFSTRLIDMQALEDRHLYYTAVFDRPETEKGETLSLLFLGIDTVCEIYLNGEKVAENRNMFVPVEISCEGLRTAGNEIVVHIIPACIATRDIPLTPLTHAMKYNYAALALRKAAYMYGWDIMPRAVSAGIWKPVFFVARRATYFSDLFLYTSKLREDYSHADLTLFWQFHTEHADIRRFRIRVEGLHGTSDFSGEERCFHTAGNLNFGIHFPHLWWPKNAGDPTLYDVCVYLYDGDELLDTARFKTGIRTVELDRTSTTDVEGNGEFCFKINHKKIFCMGTNWVPLDAYPSQNPKRLPQALDLLDDVGANIIRLWGGNVYEDDALFDFCDAHGIMIWHDFSMACAYYPQDEAFCVELRREVQYQVKRVRNHPALIVWAGDNECDQTSVWFGDPNDNVLTRKVIPEVLRNEDFSRPYLPSSPYMDGEAYASRKPISEDHLWGPRDYFKGDFYRNTVCHFASETGYHGCPGEETLARMMHADQLWPIFDENGKIRPDWLVKSSSMELDEHAPYAYRVPLMINQVKTMFGQMPKTLPAFVELSQYSQAEAFKYFIERFRLSKWRRTGIIWWNLLDGCPQISDAVVDYYFVRKKAYDDIKRSMQPVALMFDEPQGGRQTLYGVNDTPADVTVSYVVNDLVSEKQLCAGTVTLPADTSLAITDVPTFADAGTTLHFYVMEWNGEAAGRNHYSTVTRGADADAYLTCRKEFEKK